MQVSRRVREDKPGGKVSALSMYAVPPTEQLTIAEFEEFACDRLRLLSTIDMARAKGLRGGDMEKVIRKARDDFMPNTQQNLRKDMCSHFILREELRRWLLQNEVELFKWRFLNHPQEDRFDWLVRNHLDYQPISRAEYDALRGDLQAVTASRREEVSERTAHYKVPFEEVADLVRQRRVLLRGGTAYVSEVDLVSIVSNQVRMHLSKQLSNIALAWPTLRAEEAERLSGFLDGLSTQYMGGVDYSQARDADAKISLAELPIVSGRSFPPCMQSMYKKLQETNHLKHTARQQYGLFLKGIGLSCEESMTYWRAEFTKKTPLEKFNKEYAYGVRYNYGLEGKRQDWSPHSCSKIISAPGANAAAGEHHGCPFRNLDETQLRAELQRMSVSSADTTYIVDKARAHHYQVACGKFFETQHKGSALMETDLGGIMHPNQYFEESTKFYSAQQKEASKEQKTS